MSQEDRVPPHTPATGTTAVLAVCGWSGSGKTTLLEAVIPPLVADGLAVALVKHCGHGADLDRAGKDSDRLFRAGANVTIETPSESTHRAHQAADWDLRAVVARLARDHDVVLVEGHKATPLPKVWVVHRDEPDIPADVTGVELTIPWVGREPQSLLTLIRRRVSECWARRPVRGGVLIGGRSSRMRRTKSLLLHEGVTFVEHVHGALQTAASGVLLLGAGRRPRALTRVQRLPDVPGVRGPLAGIVAALRWSPHCAWIIAACDLPRLNAVAVEWLFAQRAPGRWVILPRVSEERVEPLLAIYEPQAAALVEDLVTLGGDSPRRLAGRPHVYTPTVSAELAAAWTNVNTPGDLADLDRTPAR